MIIRFRAVNSSCYSKQFLSFSLSPVRSSSCLAIFIVFVLSHLDFLLLLRSLTVWFSLIKFAIANKETRQQQRTNSNNNDDDDDENKNVKFHLHAKAKEKKNIRTKTFNEIARSRVEQKSAFGMHPFIKIVNAI